MSITLRQVRTLVGEGDVRISEHGYDELAADGIPIADAIAGVEDAVVVEDSPDYAKGPCVLVLEKDGSGNPIHVLWGIPRNASRPAVLVTAYRPDPEKWDHQYMRRKQ